MKDSIEVKGIFEVNIFKNNKLVEHYIDNNLVVTLGKTKLCKLIANDGISNYIQSISFGTSTINPTVADTAITDPFTKSLIGYEYPTTRSVKFNWELETSEANGKAISEFGLICADDTLFARKIRGTIQKESDVFLSGSWTILFI